MSRRRLVSNIPGTAGRKPHCCGGSSKQHHTNGAGEEEEWCAALDCDNPVEVGAHVYDHDDPYDWGHWIIPLCRGCNNRRDVFHVDGDVPLISANVSLAACEPEDEPETDYTGAVVAVLGGLTVAAATALFVDWYRSRPTPPAPPPQQPPPT